MKAHQPIAAWLHKQVQAHSFASLLGAAGLFALSLLVLTLLQLRLTRKNLGGAGGRGDG